MHTYTYKHPLSPSPTPSLTHSLTHSHGPQHGVQVDPGPAREVQEAAEVRLGDELVLLLHEASLRQAEELKVAALTVLD
jgi:hypothetical protein